ncbi:MAG: arylesterase [Hyphomicrobiales bacterium]
MLRAVVVAIITVLLAGVPASAARLSILAFGDSLTAGYGLPPGKGFPEKLEQALKQSGHDVRVINAGVSGDTSAAGLERLDWVLTDKVDGAIVELGANDALRGIDPARTRSALSEILAKLRSRNIPVLLAGMRAPRNLGPDYVERFDALYPELARQPGVIYYPFFLEGVAADPGLNQPDGMHPTAEGVDVIVRRMLPKIEQLIASAEK